MVLIYLKEALVKHFPLINIIHSNSSEMNRLQVTNMAFGLTAHPSLVSSWRFRMTCFSKYANITKLQMIHFNSMEMNHLSDLILGLSIPAWPETTPFFFGLMSVVRLQGHIITGIICLAVVKHDTDESWSSIWFVYYHITTGFTGLATIQSAWIT